MGSLQEPRKEDAILVDKPGPHDNYSCYRLQSSSSPQSPCPNTPPHSRDLYGIVREACAQQNIKWPVECQVIQDKVHHIEDWPIYPEAFYEQSGTELRPQPVGDEIGRLVYHYYPTSSVNYFSRSCVGGNKFLNEDVRPPLEDENDTTLQFESRFECGNLGKAVQVSECYYELHLRADMYTSRHTQWFYFAVSNTRKDITYRFSIVNLNKGDSLYNHGMRPLMYSSKEAEIHSIGWRRCATNIVYFKNHDSSDNACFDSDDDGEDDAPSYTLTFNVTFPHDHDTVYIAHCYPYSYSDMQEHLLSIQNDVFKSTVCRQRILCRSLAGNPVYLLTITSPEPEEDGKKKRAVVLTARVHPGETPSSWIMKGVLDFLTMDHPKAHELRSQFIFKVIPMLNPDGVIVGNHRCSLVGRDLNRQYKMVVKEMFPAIWHTKAMVRRLMDEHGVVMYGDFHAHSRKHNIFLYGCENRRNQDNHLREQIFPLLLHYNGGDKFSFRSCKFKVHRCKEGTARVVVWMMGVLHSYTMEASFGGASEGPRAGTHYNIHDFLSMGRQFCETLVEYFDPQPIKEKLRNKLWSRLIKKGSNADEPASIDFSETNSSSGESDHQVTPVRLRKKKIPRNPRRKMIGGRSSVAQVVDKVTSQMRMDKSDRRAKGLQHSRSGSSGSPVTSSREPLLGDRDTYEADGRDSAEPRGYLDLATKSYMEKMGELMSSRQAISDTEEGSVSNFWEPDPQPRIMLPTPRYSHSSLRRLDALEPVVAKTRLHDPRRPVRPARPPQLYTSVRTAHVIHRGTSRVQRSVLTRREKQQQGDLLREKKREKEIDKQLQYLQDDVLKDTKSTLYFDPRHHHHQYDVCDNDNLLWMRGSHSETVDLMTDPLHNGNLTYHRYSSQPSQLDMGPCDDLLVSGEEVVLRLSVPSVPRVGPAPKSGEESPFGTAPRRLGTRKVGRKTGTGKTSSNRDLDEEQLCADIAACDTLFLDTSAQETPELIAARNLKGKVKKKKAVKTVGGKDSEKKKGEKQEDAEEDKAEDEESGNVIEDNEKDSSESLQPDGKVKKKIKIVIGKKVKTKPSRKSLAEKDTLPEKNV
ncbi:cytosolic carboxypeptidase 2-like isoform X3 [Palaemon carinicauda]|uniref:cytosolic carboxypeptidase 2-like isoform X3 n=1 Tax=Palaemon carinicauda TaxID=392227 RepID=UPI0035B5CFA0